MTLTENDTLNTFSFLVNKSFIILW